MRPQGRLCLGLAGQRARAVPRPGESFWRGGPRTFTSAPGMVSKPSQCQSLCWGWVGRAQHRSQGLNRPLVGTGSSEPWTAKPGWPRGVRRPHGGQGAGDPGLRCPHIPIFSVNVPEPATPTARSWQELVSPRPTPSMRGSHLSLAGPAPASRPQFTFSSITHSPSLRRVTPHPGPLLGDSGHVWLGLPKP